MSGSYFRPRRNIQRSVIEYLTDQVNSSWSNVTVAKSYKEVAAASPPVICVEVDNVTSEKLELGSNSLSYEYMVVINIFATSDALRMDLSDFVLDVMKDGCTYYEYSQDETYAISGTDSGRVSLVSVNTDEKIDMEETVSSKEKYRHQIILIMRKN